MLAAHLRNLGQRAGRQVVQLYDRSRIPGRVARRAVLLGHLAVTAEPGETVQVTVGVDAGAVPGLGPVLAGDGAVELWLPIDGPGNIPDRPALIHANAWN